MTQTAVQTVTEPEETVTEPATEAVNEPAIEQATEPVVKQVDVTPVETAIEQVADKARRVMIVTGGNSGLGLECCKALGSLENIHLIVAGRSKEKVDEAIALIKSSSHPTTVLEPGIVDLSKFESIKLFASTFLDRNLPLFALVCNAGYQTVNNKTMTADGFEMTFGTNHLGHFLLTYLLQERLNTTPESRVVVVSSSVHDPSLGTGLPAPIVSNWEDVAMGTPTFSGARAYSTSKLCNLLFGYELARKYPQGPSIFVYDPGFVPDTGLTRHMSPILWKIISFFVVIYCKLRGLKVSTPAKSGSFMAQLASDTKQFNLQKSGSYFSVDEPMRSSDLSRNETVAAELWEHSLKWCKLTESTSS